MGSWPQESPGDKELRAESGAAGRYCFKAKATLLPTALSGGSWATLGVTPEQGQRCGPHVLEEGAREPEVGGLA